MEHPELTWSGRDAYLMARDEAKQIDLFGWDLVWKLVSSRFVGDIPMPSEIYRNAHRVDRRTAKQIYADVIKGLGGE